jgi:hypothetical protein
MSQPDPHIPYRREKPDAFSAALQAISWKEDKGLAIISLVSPCPTCGHEDGIDIALPTTWALWDKTPEKAAQFVECQCAEKHDGRPDGVTGCGRSGMVTPHLGNG